MALPLPLAVSALGLTAVTLSTATSLRRVAASRGKDAQAPALYEDADGKATEESMAAYSTAGPKIAMGVFAGLGFGVSIATAVLAVLDGGLEGFEAGWVNAGAWVRFLRRLEHRSIYTASTKDTC